MSGILGQLVVALLVSTSVALWAQNFIKGQVRYENGQLAECRPRTSRWESAVT